MEAMGGLCKLQLVEARLITRMSAVITRHCAPHGIARISLTPRTFRCRQRRPCGEKAEGGALGLFQGVGIAVSLSLSVSLPPALRATAPEPGYV